MSQQRSAAIGYAGGMATAPSDCASTLVKALAASLPAELIATHISWVLLAGELAYKIKQPVRLPFVDYSSLDARRRFCEEEVRLNRRLAPSLYLGVSRITGTPEVPRIDGAGAAVEYAVRMRRFAPGSLYSEQLAAGTLAPADVDALAALLGDFHQQAPVAPAGSGFGNPAARRAVAVAALGGAAPVTRDGELAALREWLEREAAALAPLWNARLDAGRVRECHGDLHLGNVVSLDGGVAAFDGIEFDCALRWIDVLDDLAFPVMDLAARGRRDLAFRLLNGWLDRTGEHAGVPALPFAAVYRALVRAQVEHLRGPAHAEAARRCIKAALTWTQRPAPGLTITHGLPGSGKTFQSQRLLEAAGAIRLRSDVERKRLFGLGILEGSGARGLSLYTADATARTYEHLFATARTLLQARWAVVLDAAFLRRAERVRARSLARELQAPFAILECRASPGVLRQRLRARRQDASEADVAVLEQLEAVAEPLSPEELAFAVGLSGDGTPVPAPLNPSADRH